MNNYFITSDATCDLPKQLYKENFAVIPMSYVVGGEIYEGTEKSSLDPQVFYDRVCQGEMPTTSLINEDFAKDFFIPILNKGYDIFHVCFSSALSGTYKSMLSAAEALKKQYPDRKIYILDGKCASLEKAFWYIIALKSVKTG